MKKGKEKLLEMKDTDNFEGMQLGREHIELLKKTKAFTDFEKKESKKLANKLDMILTKIYLAL
ncbi:MAG: hypothetical protein KA120_04020 [Candidatus Goldbacteria bacterium]|nr:hypothetical protein [Candidatus Goldiibacteriota bacterium]HPD19067.1 hypothetical protein [Candidatus Goldiibacteriota bacterium]